MVEQIGRHGLLDLTVRAVGDVEIDGHHTTEDLGIVLGQAVLEALGDKAGLVRYGWATLPMDEALVTAAIDLSGRPFFVWKVPLPKAKLAEYAGTYTSDELDVALTVAPVGELLILRRRPADEMLMRPVYDDDFATSIGSLRFTRDASGRVTGFGVYSGRIRNVRFSKR